MKPKDQEWFTKGSWTKFPKGSKNETKESRSQVEICIQEGISVLALAVILG